MSNRRRSGFRNAYRAEFLRSPAWHARRDRWFSNERRLHRHLECAACAGPATKNDLELHHLDYGGVLFRDGAWRAFERHNDLIAMHPYCHELLHRLIDRDVVLSRGRDRRTASRSAIDRLRRKLSHRREMR